MKLTFEELPCMVGISSSPAHRTRKALCSDDSGRYTQNPIIPINCSKSSILSSRTPHYSSRRPPLQTATTFEKRQNPQNKTTVGAAHCQSLPLSSQISASSTADASGCTLRTSFTHANDHTDPFKPRLTQENTFCSPPTNRLPSIISYPSLIYSGKARNSLQTLSESLKHTVLNFRLARILNLRTAPSRYLDAAPVFLSFVFVFEVWTRTRTIFSSTWPLHTFRPSTLKIQKRKKQPAFLHPLPRDFSWHHWQLTRTRSTLNSHHGSSAQTFPHLASHCGTRVDPGVLGIIDAYARDNCPIAGAGVGDTGRA